MGFELQDTRLTGLPVSDRKLRHYRATLQLALAAGLAAEAKAARTMQGYTSAVRWFAAGYLLCQAFSGMSLGSILLLAALGLAAGNEGGRVSRCHG